VKRAALLLAVAAALLLPACGGDDEPTATETDTVTLPALSTARVYWLRDGKVWPAAREVQASDDAQSAVLGELFAGPTDQEQADLEFETAIPSDVVMAEIRADSEGTVEIPLTPTLSKAAQAQLVYTLTQFDEVKRVRIDGESYTRADFEDQTPSVLVESPLPFEEVTGPIHAEGTANTFEATFNYELTDTDGRIVDENFVTATSGTGTRGTFEFTTDEYEIPFDGIGSLIVFERSAEDGSKIHIVEIPLRMSK
jgi:Immunoglobulin-like domain of bacterial spore germination/Sporulation and spore germination